MNTTCDVVFTSTSYLISNSLNKIALEDYVRRREWNHADTEKNKMSSSNVMRTQDTENLNSVSKADLAERSIT